MTVKEIYYPQVPVFCFEQKLKMGLEKKEILFPLSICKLNYLKMIPVASVFQFSLHEHGFKMFKSLFEIREQECGVMKV
jgi:hypothetical protein